MTSIEVLTLLVMLFTKHLFVDFPLQTSYQYLNKGTYGHPGGLLHSGYHAIATFLIVLLFNPVVAIAMAMADFAIHYHVDYAKVYITKKFNWSPTTHEEFWWILGLDQYLHTLTYLAIALILVTL